MLCTLKLCSLINDLLSSQPTLDCNNIILRFMEIIWFAATNFWIGLVGSEKCEYRLSQQIPCTWINVSFTAFRLCLRKCHPLVHITSFYKMLYWSCLQFILFNLFVFLIYFYYSYLILFYLFKFILFKVWHYLFVL